MSDDLKQTFWKRLGKVQAAMLTAGEGRPVPMSPYADPDENAIWFITARGTDLTRAAEKGERAALSVSDSSAHLYANVEGSVRLVDNPAKLEELWNVVADAWFEDGRDDSDIRLVRLSPREAEVWATDGSAVFLYEIAKAQLTDAKPDMGDHGRITF